MTGFEPQPSSQANGLHRVGQRPPLGAYLAEAWARRQFAFTLAGHRLVAALLQNRLGMLWLILRPLAMAATYGLIFSVILSSAARPQGFVQFIVIGLCVFDFFTHSLTGGAKSITGNAKLVQSLGFPRILLPTSVVIEEALRMIPIAGLIYVIVLVFGEPVTWSWLLIFPILAVMAVFNLGCALFAARLSVHARDVQQLIPILTRVLLYASGIFFDLDGALAGNPTALLAVHLFPTYEFVAMARGALLHTYTAPPIVWIAGPIWAIVLVVLGTIFFWRAEVRYGLSD